MRDKERKRQREREKERKWEKERATHVDIMNKDQHRQRSEAFLRK